MLELKNVSKYYNNNGVVSLGLRNINLKLNKGEIVAITGDSGSGKSTLLNVITGVDTYEDGEILFYGNETSYFNQDDMDVFRKNNVSFIYQKYNIIESYTVLENIMLPLLMAGKAKADAKKEALAIAKKVGLEDRVNNKGSKLSGGEKQRCVIARALASDSKILACDEPTGNLDSETGKKIIDLIKEVAQDKLVLIVTHNYDQVKDIVTRKIKISDGEIVEDTIFKSFPDEEKQELNLSTSKIQKNVIRKVAFQNIVSTPNKTTLVSLVFFFIALITITLSTLMMQQAKSSFYMNNRNYGIVDDTRLIVYDKNHDGLNKAELDKLNIDNLKYNAFYEETRIIYSNNNRYYRDFKTTDLKFKYKIVKGRDMEKEGEYILVLPKQDSASRYVDFYDSNLYVAGDKYFSNGDDFKTRTNIGTITGIAKSSVLSEPYIVSYGKVDQQIINIANSHETNFSYNINGLSREIEVVQQSTIPQVTTIYIPFSLKGKAEIETKVRNLYPIKYDTINIVYGDMYSTTEPRICYGLDYFGGTLEGTFDKAYEATIYDSNAKKLSNKITELGYNATMPTLEKTNNNINLIIFYLFLFLIVVALILLFFISFAVLSRIYSSKAKDYSILRALGMVKKDLGSIVKIETIFLSFVSCLFSLIVFTVVTLCIPSIQLERFLSIPLVLGYFIAMIVFAYLIARRFNYKLFKFSVNTEMKEGALND